MKLSNEYESELPIIGGGRPLYSKHVELETQLLKRLATTPEKMFSYALRNHDFYIASHNITFLNEAITYFTLAKENGYIHKVNGFIVAGKVDEYLENISSWQQAISRGY